MQRLVTLSDQFVDISDSLASGRLLGLATATFIVFLTVILPEEASRSTAYLGDDPTPDGSFSYSPSDLYDMARTYGADGRRYYIRSRFTFDIVWPLAYGWFLWTGIAYFQQGLTDARVKYAVLLPLLAVLLDFTENTSASVVMFLYPGRLPVLSHLVSVFTFGNGS